MPALSWPFEIPDRSKSASPLDVLCLGHALVDRLAFATEEDIVAAGLAVNSMTLVNGARAAELDEAVADWRQVAGGSAANTAAGIASLGGAPGFAGAVGDDVPGKWYSTDLEAGGVACYLTAVSSGSPTGVCHVFVTHDGHRTMATSLEAACELSVPALEDIGIDRVQAIYMEGYLLDALAEAALWRALELAKDCGALVTLSLSDHFVVERHHDRISELVFGPGGVGRGEGGAVDLLLGNEDEAMYLTGAPSFEEATAALQLPGRAAVVTRGAAGSVIVLPEAIVSVPACNVPRVEDTTGAGDLFASGVLFGMTHGASPEQALRLGSYAAGEVITHLGARPEVRLSEVVPAGVL